MPTRNVVCIALASLISLACYSISTKNRYGNLFSEALDIVSEEALIEVPERQLFDAAMNGMMRMLDENSSFISQDRYKSFDEDLNQEFVGVGMEFERLEEQKCFRVVAPLPGTPAWQAGLRIGDLILAIDGMSTEDLDRGQAIDKIRGPKGEQVSLLIGREGKDQPFEVPVTRDFIPVPSVKGDSRNQDGTWNFYLESEPEIAYVRLLQFGRKSTEELRQILQQVNGKARALILDLRFNGGGLLNAAVDISDFFLDGELLVVQTRQRGGQVVSRRFASGETELSPEIPMVVLVNGQSASASEIVAASLQDHNRAVVAGQQTYGKGTVQDLITLEHNRSILRLTTASYWRPSGKNIDRTVLPLDDPTQYGVSPNPDMEIVLTNQQSNDYRILRIQRDQEVFNPGKKLQPNQPDWLEVDAVLKRAVDHLRKRLQTAASSAAA